MVIQHQSFFPASMYFILGWVSGKEKMVDGHGIKTQTLMTPFGFSHLCSSLETP